MTKEDRKQHLENELAEIKIKKRTLIKRVENMMETEIMLKNELERLEENN